MNEKFNPAQATRAMFTEAINRALNDMTDAQVEDLCRSMVGTEMSQRQMADLEITQTYDAAIATIRSEMTLKASADSLLAESTARNNGDTALSNAITEEAGTRLAADQKLEGGLAETIDKGAKNILAFNAIGSGNYHAQTYTSKGVKYTLNNDGTITVNRESASSDLSSCIFYLNDVSFKVDNFCNGKFVLSGCPSGGGSSSYEIYVYQSGYSYKDYGDGLVLPNHGEITGIYMGINVRASASPSNLIFKPMICKKTDWEISQAYQPYAPTNRELYEMILALQSGRSLQSAPASLMQAGRLDAELTDAQEVTDDA